MNLDGIVAPNSEGLVVGGSFDKADFEGYEDSRETSVYFYPEGPEYRIEYIHDRVEF